MDGYGKGKGFVDGEVGGESGFLLILDNCWFGLGFSLARKPEEHLVGARFQILY